ncbi:MAG: ComF family protein [Rhodospirillales bacterium]|nr:ComF family protein [Rhodospirillales bacterium]
MELQQLKEIQSDRDGFLCYLKPFKPFFQQTVDLILPPRCAFSGKIVSQQGAIQPEEWTKLQFISDPFCRCCGHPFDFKIDADMCCPSCLSDPPEFSKARAPLLYEDQSRSLILRFKHADQLHTLDTFLPWMLKAGASLLEQTDLILPVPLHRWRLIKRRYNQAALIAARISKKANLPWHHDLLLRARATPTQGHKKALDRKKNVKDAFTVPARKKNLLTGKTILLIDDVYTTGATVRECSRTLLNAGAAEVNVLTLARVVKR